MGITASEFNSLNLTGKEFNSLKLTGKDFSEMSYDDFVIRASLIIERFKTLPDDTTISDEQLNALNTVTEKLSDYGFMKPIKWTVSGIALFAQGFLGEAGKEAFNVAKLLIVEFMKIIEEFFTVG